jgi:hypothetical protein
LGGMASVTRLRDSSRRGVGLFAAKLTREPSLKTSFQARLNH